MKFALAGFGREVGGNVVDMIGERADMNAAGTAETYLALGGRPMDLAGLGFGERRRPTAPSSLAKPASWRCWEST